MSHARLRMRLRLTEQVPVTHWPCRTIEPGDALALGALMLAAYQGTIDYEGETLDQAEAAVRAMLAGEHGAFIPACSLVAEHAGQPVGACLITLWHGEPLVCSIMVHPGWKNRGLGTSLLQRSAEILFAHGYTDLILFVTAGNANAQHIYQKLGFRVEESEP